MFLLFEVYKLFRPALPGNTITWRRFIERTSVFRQNQDATVIKSRSSMCATLFTSPSNLAKTYRSWIAQLLNIHTDWSAWQHNSQKHAYSAKGPILLPLILLLIIDVTPQGPHYNKLGDINSGNGAGRIKTSEAFFKVDFLDALIVLLYFWII